MNTEILTTTLGMSEKEARVYLAILELGEATVQPISRRSSIKRTSIYYFIDHLVENGLISQAQIRGRKHYKAEPPEKLIELQKSRLKHVEEALPQFLSIYNVSTRKPRISYFEGAEQVKNIIREEPKCQKEMWAIWSAKDISEMVRDHKFMQEIERERVEKGIKIKVIRIREKDEPFSEFSGGPGQNRELRYAPEGTVFPMAISIYDTGKVGLMSSKKEGFGILIESEELVMVMRVFFEALWAQSKEIELRAESMNHKTEEPGASRQVGWLVNK